MISLLALIGQMALPVAHAQTMAQRNGNPMLSAFCGELSATLLHKLVESAPPELIKRVRSDQQKLATTSCSLCASVHSGHLAGLPSSSFETVSDSGFIDAGYHATPHPFVQLVRLPELRGPPPLS